MRLGILIPSAGTVKAQFALNLAQLTTVFMMVMPDDTECKLYMEIGSVIAANRDSLVDRALADDCTHLLFIDDDMGFDFKAVWKLLERDLPIVLCNYRMKNPPYPFLCKSLDMTELQTTWDTTGIEEINYGGFGLCLIKAEVFDKVHRPRFLPIYDIPSQGYSTEDYPFFKLCREAGYPIFVDHDASRMVTHHGSFVYSYNLKEFNLGA